jgi:hypothetical protein
MGDLLKPLLRAADLAERTGLSERYFQKLAKSGKIDWATQPGGDHSAILFEEEGFEKWYDKGRKKATPKWQQSTGAADGRGRARRSREWKDANPLAHVLRQKLKNVSSSSSQR